MTIANLLEIGNKIIDQMQSILWLKKTKNLNKQAIKVVENLAIIF